MCGFVLVLHWMLFLYRMDSCGLIIGGFSVVCAYYLRANACRRRHTAWRTVALSRVRGRQVWRRVASHWDCHDVSYAVSWIVSFHRHYDLCARINPVIYTAAWLMRLQWAADRIGTKHWRCVGDVSRGSNEARGARSYMKKLADILGYAFDLEDINCFRLCSLCCIIASRVRALINFSYTVEITKCFEWRLLKAALHCRAPSSTANCVYELSLETLRPARPHMHFSSLLIHCRVINSSRASIPSSYLLGCWAYWLTT